MSGPISGSGGKVFVGDTEVADVRWFAVPRHSEVKSYASSTTGGYEKTAAGRKRWSLTMSLYAPSGSLDLGFDVGDLVVVRGQTAAGKGFEGRVRVRSIEPEVDVEGAGLVGLAVAGVGHGAYSLTG